MNVLSLFDGMSCTQLALQKLGVRVDNYWASEVDKYAIKVTQANFPNTKQVGDVRNIGSSRNLHFTAPIDLLVGGSPCQGFSFAGKHLNFDDERSKLFFEFVRVFKEVKPKYFLLENVRMKKESEAVITEALGVEPIMINSSLVSAQNRKRLYWTNLPVNQPKDKGIMLSDILENGQVDRKKSHCLDANYFKGGNLKTYFEKHRRQLVFSRDGLCHVGDADLKGIESIKRVYHKAGKAPTLTTMGGGHREPKVLCGAFRGRYNSDGSTSQQLELRFDDKTNSLTTVQKDNVAVLPEELKWRKLTPLECERLQTVPDNYTNHVSNTQRYKMLGNGFTVDVIAHILKGLDNA